jgi:large subunit ribosomal protein L18
MVIAGGLMKKSRSVQRKLYRLKRHKRVRKKVFGTAERPRLCIFRSNQNIYAQLIDDVKGETLVSASTLDRELKEWRGKKNIEAAKQVGFLIAKRALERGVKQVVLDRGGYKYHGRVKALADSAREGGLEF